MIGLRTGLTKITGLWVGKLLSHGCVYHETLTNTYILSLGFQSAGGLCWGITPVGPTDDSGNHEFFSLTSASVSLEDCRARLQFFSTTNVWSPSSNEVEEDYAGVPTRICFLASLSWFIVTKHII